MILKNYYYWFENVVNDYMCEKIIQYGNSLREEVAATGDQASQNMTPEAISKLKKEMRNSNVSWINEKWLYDMISPYVDKANKDAGWNFHIDYVEPVQFTKYKLNQYYNWHADSSEKIINNPNDLNFHGKVRKLSCIVFLLSLKSQELKHIFQFLILVLPLIQPLAS